MACDVSLLRWCLRSRYFRLALGSGCPCWIFPRACGTCCRRPRAMLRRHHKKRHHRKKFGAWRETTDKDSGKKYWYNKDTNERRWDPPPGWNGPDDGVAEVAKTQALSHKFKNRMLKKLRSVREEKSRRLRASRAKLKAETMARIEQRARDAAAGVQQTGASEADDDLDPLV